MYNSNSNDQPVSSIDPAFDAGDAASSPVFALQQQEHIKLNALNQGQGTDGYEGDSEGDSDESAPDSDKDRKSSKKHHGGSGGGGHDGERRSTKQLVITTRVLRKSFRKVRQSVTSEKDLLRLRLELHRLESQIGLSSEL